MNGIKWSKINKTASPDTVIIICAGPSLKEFNLQKLKGLGYVIAVNDTVKFAPFADMWFTLDPWGCGSEGKQYPKNFEGELYAAVPEDYGTYNAKSLDHRVTACPKMNYLHRIPFHTSNVIKSYDYLTWGLNEDVGSINTGNSGYGALNVAYHLKPKRVVYFGLDASAGYFYNDKSITRSLNHLPSIFRSALPQLRAANIEVLNASQNSNIDCFPRYSFNAIMNKLNSPV
jgi:hypothetical protein